MSYYNSFREEVLQEIIAEYFPQNQQDTNPDIEDTTEQENMDLEEEDTDLPMGHPFFDTISEITECYYK